MTADAVPVRKGGQEIATLIALAVGSLVVTVGRSKRIEAVGAADAHPRGFRYDTRPQRRSNNAISKARLPNVIFVTNIILSIRKSAVREALKHDALRRHRRSRAGSWRAGIRIATVRRDGGRSECLTSWHAAPSGAAKVLVVRRKRNGHGRRRQPLQHKR